MPESPPTTGVTQKKRSSQEMEVEEADKSLGNAVPPVKRDKKDLMDVDDEVDQSPRKSPMKSLVVPSSAKKDSTMEIEEAEKTEKSESPAKATNSMDKVEKDSIESDEDEKTKEKSPVKKTKNFLNHFTFSNDNEEKSPAKAPAKKDTQALDEFVSDDEDGAEAAAAKPSNDKEVQRTKKAVKDFTKKWRDQPSNVDGETDCDCEMVLEKLTSNIDYGGTLPAEAQLRALLLVRFVFLKLALIVNGGCNSTENFPSVFLVPDYCTVAYPASYVDTKFKHGVDGFVPLPFSHPQTTRSAGTSTRPRGQLIAEALNSFANGLRDLQHLEAGIRTYWRGFHARTLRKMFTGASPELQKSYLSTITGIAKIALRSKELVTKPLPELRYDDNTIKSVSMSQEQAACLLAYAFFCTILHRGDDFNHFSLHNFHMKPSSSFIEKMKFILFYFKTVIAEMPRGTLTFSRQLWNSEFGKADEREGYDKWKDPLSDMLVLSEARADYGIGLIEEMEGCLHVDFANEYIGGGVMGHGAVQEEIRFLCCPEMLVSLLLCDRMEPHEAILIQGAQQYSAYTGYSDSLKHMPLKLRRGEPRDCYGRARSYLVAIDAVRFTKKGIQYLPEFIARETKKAYAGFMRDKDAPARPIATGNWGCGVFNGDKELKSLIQWVAASKAGRPLIYITFKEATFAEELKQIVECIKDHKVGNANPEVFDIRNTERLDLRNFVCSLISKLFSLLTAYRENRADPQQGVFSFIRDVLQSGVPF
ncbi:parg-1 [Pristionchus pacificus]|nr:parg-1 [Pristionchus pacificus]|eukprot:PDM65579.1 parg-1 [Pristionchus pacificus]